MWLSTLRWFWRRPAYWLCLQTKRLRKRVCSIRPVGLNALDLHLALAVPRYRCILNA